MKTLIVVVEPACVGDPTLVIFSETNVDLRELSQAWEHLGVSSQMSEYHCSSMNVRICTTFGDGLFIVSFLEGSMQLRLILSECVLLSSVACRVRSVAIGAHRRSCRVTLGLFPLKYQCLLNDYSCYLLRTLT